MHNFCQEERGAVVYKSDLVVERFWALERRTITVVFVSVGLQNLFLSFQWVKIHDLILHVHTYVTCLSFPLQIKCRLYDSNLEVIYVKFPDKLVYLLHITCCV